MTPNITEVIQHDVIGKLKTIPDVWVIDGFVQHHINDLRKEKKLPAIFVHSIHDNTLGNTAGNSSKLGRDIKIIGLVSPLKKGSIQRELDDLLYKIRAALFVSDEDDHSSKSMNLSLGGAKFEPSEAGDPFAFVELDITLTYQEKWR